MKINNKELRRIIREAIQSESGYKKGSILNEQGYGAIRGGEVPGEPEGRARHGAQRERLRRDGVGCEGVRAHVAPESSLRPGLPAEPRRFIERGPPRAQEEPQAFTLSA